MYTVYLTGGIGAGKSTALAVLAGKGAAAVDLDAVGHEALADPAVAARLEAVFGGQVLGPEGSVDRQALAACAFSSPEATAALDAATHPAIIARLLARLDELAAQGTTLAVVEVQVAEAGDPSLADETLTLACPRQVRRARALARGMAPEEFDRRDARQVCDDHRCALADAIIDASGTPDQVKAQLDAWFDTRAANGWRAPGAQATQTPALRPPVQPSGLPSPVVAFVGRHNSGKTTLVEKIISELVARGRDVGSVKHHGHAGFELDVPGKDSWRHRKAGASEVAISAPDQFALIRSLPQELSMAACVGAMQAHDVVVIEGYRYSDLPTVEIMRAANKRDRAAAAAFIEAAQPGEPPLLPPFVPEDDQAAPESTGAAQTSIKTRPNVVGKLPDGQTVAVVTDMPRVARTARSQGMRAFGLADVGPLCDFIEREVMGLAEDGRPPA